MPESTPHRFPTREVRIGDLAIGASNPILIQSMTIADTMNTEAVCEEIRRLVEEGCPLVRVTAPSRKEAENLRAIRSASGPTTSTCRWWPTSTSPPTPPSSRRHRGKSPHQPRKLRRPEAVQGVRGFPTRSTDSSSNGIRDKFVPLVKRLKMNGAALRIGTNHGSLSDRIMNRFGDTPEGMVESALEFVRICEDEGYRDIVLSMKSSIPSVMIAAYRLLVQKMIAEGMNYPIHIGVTEAGDGLEGRVKSAVGIASLLATGIGDTIRVSLTEDAHHEIGAAENILRAIPDELGSQPAAPVTDLAPWLALSTDSSHERRETDVVTMGSVAMGGDNPVRVEFDAALELTDGRARFRADDETRRAIRRAGREEGAEVLIVSPKWPTGAPRDSDLAAVRAALSGDAFVAAGRVDGGVRPPVILDWGSLEPPPAAIDSLAGSVHGFSFELVPEREETWDALDRAALPTRFTVDTAADGARVAAGARHPFALSLRPGAAYLPRLREVIARPELKRVPIVLRLPRDGSHAAMWGGSALNRGVGDSVCLTDEAFVADPWPTGGVDWDDDAVMEAYRLLQACRVRHTRAEFIACPSCGRTQFDLQSTTARIRARTAHLKGVKIAIMGCIVNGPGEMADADFGYVGSGAKKIDLYVGKERVERNIPEADAEERLVELLRAHDAWIDPPVETDAPT